MGAVYAPAGGPGSDDPGRGLLGGSGQFDVDVSGGVVRARRRRRAPDRGLLRLLLPRVVVRLRTVDRWSVRPDGLAIGTVVVLLGGLVVEATMDRARYPREYPPEFVYGLACAYGLLLAFELRATRAAVRRALAPLNARG